MSFDTWERYWVLGLRMRQQWKQSSTLPLLLIKATSRGWSAQHVTSSLPFEIKHDTSIDRIYKHLVGADGKTWSSFTTRATKPMPSSSYFLASSRPFPFFLSPGLTLGGTNSWLRTRARRFRLGLLSTWPNPRGPWMSSFGLLERLCHSQAK